jgi:hypothetical protein
MKFHGHELFTSLIACLIREDRWELIGLLLAEGIPVKYKRIENGPGTYFFEEVSQPLRFAQQLSDQRGRLSVHADILKARYSPDRPLGQVMPFDDFTAADYFLFLRGELAAETPPTGGLAWRPWAGLYLDSAPRFIRDAVSAAVAKRIVAALALPDVPTFCRRLSERADRLRRLCKDPFGNRQLPNAMSAELGRASRAIPANEKREFLDPTSGYNRRLGHVPARPKWTRLVMRGRPVSGDQGKRYMKEADERDRPRTRGSALQPVQRFRRMVRAHHAYENVFQRLRSGSQIGHGSQFH